MSKSNDLCEVCERSSSNLQEFAEFSHLKPCAIKDSDGKVRQSVEPVFSNSVEMCFPCYNAATKEYISETNSPKAKIR